MTSQRTLDARNAAALPVGAAINEVEASINATFVKIGEVFSNIGRARLDPIARMPLSVGMAAAEKAALAASALSAAYRFSVEAHGELATDKGLLGLKIVDWGDFTNTYSAFDERRTAPASTSVPGDGLRIVA